MFDNKDIFPKTRDQITKSVVSSAIINPVDIELTEEAFQKAIEDLNLEVYPEDNYNKFRTDLRDRFLNNQLTDEEIEKARKDISKLKKVFITDKNGDRRTVYVKQGDTPVKKKEYKSHTKEDVEEIKATIKRQKSLLSNPKSPAGAKRRAEEIIAEEQKKLDRIEGKAKLDEPSAKQEAKDHAATHEKIKQDVKEDGKLDMTKKELGESIREDHEEVDGPGEDGSFKSKDVLGDYKVKGNVASFKFKDGNEVSVEFSDLEEDDIKDYLSEPNDNDTSRNNAINVVGEFMHGMQQGQVQFIRINGEPYEPLDIDDTDGTATKDTVLSHASTGEQSALGDILSKKKVEKIASKQDPKVKKKTIQHPVYGEIPAEDNGVNDNWGDKVVAKYFSLGKEQEMTIRADGIFDGEGKLAARSLKDLKQKWNWPGARIRFNPDLSKMDLSKIKTKIHAHGFKGEDLEPWKKTFSNVEEMNKWAKENQADIHDYKEQ